jgi:hypothetical protein
MPFVPDTLVIAGDMNVVLSDVALALTNSLAADGSTPLTADLNLNGHNIGGVGTLTASVVTTQFLNATVSANIVALNAPLNANGQNITGVGTLTAGNTTLANLTVPGVSTLASVTVSSGITTGSLTATSGNITNLTVGNQLTTYGLTVQLANIVALAGPMNANNQAISNIGALTAANATITTLATNALIVGDNGGGIHPIIWQNDGWEFSWNASDGSTVWWKPGGYWLLILDGNGHLTTRSGVSFAASPSRALRGDALAAITAEPTWPEEAMIRVRGGSSAVSVGPALALLFRAVQQLAERVEAMEYLPA